MKDLDLPRFQKLGFKFLPRQLEIPDETDFETWQKLGGVLGYIGGSVQFWWGDWMAHGERYEGKYDDAVELTNMDRGTLWNWKSIAKAIPPGERRLELSYASHRAVAHLDAGTRDIILEEAVENDWKSERICKEIKARGLMKSRPEKVEMFGYELEFDRRLKALKKNGDTVAGLEGMMNGITNKLRELAENGNAGDARLRTAGVAMVRALMQTGLDPRQVYSAYARELRLPETRKENAEQAGLFER